MLGGTFKHVENYTTFSTKREEISYNAAKEVIKSLEKINILTERESKIILYSIEDNVLCIPISELKDKLRANILQNIVIGLLHIDESA